MEDTLRGQRCLQASTLIAGLNPCCNGRYSQSVASKENRNGVKVLILVVMEDTLRGNPI